MFLGIITKHSLRRYHIVVMQSNVHENQIDSNFQVSTRPERFHCLKCRQQFKYTSLRYDFIIIKVPSIFFLKTLQNSSEAIYIEILKYQVDLSEATS